jgi:hypothetical protein
MAQYCHFWRITPGQFEDLGVEEYYAFGRYMQRWQKAQEDN